MHIQVFWFEDSVTKKGIIIQLNNKDNTWEAVIIKDDGSFIFKLLDDVTATMVDRENLQCLFGES